MFSAGPVGLMAAYSAVLRGASKVFVVGGITSARAARVRTSSAFWSRPSARRPAITPSMSACGRFWLSLALASMRVMASSTPTIARN